MWKSIWQLKVPNVVKVFMWRACHDAFLMKAKLFKKKVVLDSLCLICGLEEQTLAHILWNCPSTRDVWSVCSRKLKKCSVLHAEFISNVKTICNIVSKKDFEVMAVVARNL